MRLRASSRRIRRGKVCSTCYFSAYFPRVARRVLGSDLFSGGSLGWKVRGSLDAAFEKAAYDLEPSSTGNPKYAEVKSGHGYHIIMVEGRR